MIIKFNEVIATENKNKSKLIRAILCIAITSLIFLAFFARLFKWQIVNTDKYKEISKTSTSYTVTSEKTRGEIFDCNGKALVKNTASYNVVIDKLYLESKKQNDIIAELVSLMEDNKKNRTDDLPININKNGEFEFDKNKNDEIEYIKSSQILNMGVYATAQDYINAFVSRYEIDGDYDSKTLRDIISVRYNMELEGFDYQTPYVFARDISEKTVAVIAENMQDQHSVEVVQTQKRTAVDGTLMPHILGTTGSINEEEYDALKDKGYELNDKIGKFGVEAAMESELKGEKGVKTVMRNSDGTVVDIIDETPAKPGNSIYLTVDAALQKAANDSLAKNIKAARAAGEESVREAEYLGKEQQEKLGEDCKTGAAVMLSVKNFSVLCASSYPGYDLAKYSDYDYYTSLLNDKNTPLYDRAFSGSFAPGSVFKPLVALAALEENTIKESTHINCTQIYDYYKKDPVHCMGRHGNIDLHSAIVQSCNYYFAETGRRLGIDPMYLYAEKFGLGVSTGIEVEESSGVLAGRDSKNWTQGNTVQAAIGQSDNTFTPLQLATYTATLANNGVRLKTHIISKVTDYQGDKTINENNPENPTVINESPVSDENLKKVQSAMYDVVHSESGTAYSVFGNYKIPVAAKTGTAENSGSDHAVFICYAPYDKPQVAVAVVLEHGAKGTYAMNVAKDMLNAYFK